MWLSMVLKLGCEASSAGWRRYGNLRLPSLRKWCRCGWLWCGCVKFWGWSVQRPTLHERSYKRRFGKRPYIPHPCKSVFIRGKIQPAATGPLIRVIRVIRGKKEKAVELCGLPPRARASLQPAQQLTTDNWQLTTHKKKARVSAGYSFYQRPEVFTIFSIPSSW